MKKFYVVDIKSINAEMLVPYIQLENKKSNKYLYLIKSTFLDNINIEKLYETPHLHKRFSKKDMIWCDTNKNSVYKAFETEKEALEFIELKNLNLKLKNLISNNFVHEDKLIIDNLDVLKDFIKRIDK